MLCWCLSKWSLGRLMAAHLFRSAAFLLTSSFEKKKSMQNSMTDVGVVWRPKWLANVWLSQLNMVSSTAGHACCEIHGISNDVMLTKGLDIMFSLCVKQKVLYLLAWFELKQTNLNFLILRRRSLCTLWKSYEPAKEYICLPKSKGVWSAHSLQILYW